MGDLRVYPKKILKSMASSHYLFLAGLLDVSDAKRDERANFFQANTQVVKFQKEMFGNLENIII
ncbi:MAG: hypothetical protein WCO05_00395 [Candidatus Moraniibacteriota bacterium]|jgi:hypothetical protein